MGGEKQPFRWIALFRDGHSIEQSAAAESSAFQSLMDYMHGTKEDPKKHYLLWFKITNGDIDYTVSFDRDGDAYIDTPDGKCHMTELKIRSAQLIFSADTPGGMKLGFGGINTCGDPDGRAVTINPDGDYIIASDFQLERVMIKT